MGADQQHARPSRPFPAPSALTAPYWNAVAQGSLAIQRCVTCSRFMHPPRSECRVCGGTRLQFEQVSGIGVVETFSIVHRSFAPGFQESTPYVIAWIALDEQAGLRVFSNIVGVETSDVFIGMPVTLTRAHIEGFGAIPEFIPFAHEPEQQE